MRILGVDPGTLVVGFGCLELQGVGRDGIAGTVAGGAAASATVPVAHRVRNLAHCNRARLTVVAAGALRLGRSADAVEARLRLLADGIVELLERWSPDELAIEEAYFGKSVQSALRVGESRGVILAEAARAGLRVHQFPPARIKRSVAGSGSATKQQVAVMVAQTLRLPAVPETFDVSDALAVGLCRAEDRRSFRA